MKWDEERIRNIEQQVHHLYKRQEKIMASMKDVTDKLASIGSLTEQVIAKYQEQKTAADAAATQTATDLDGVLATLADAETKLTNALNPPPAVDQPK